MTDLKPVFKFKELKNFFSLGDYLDKTSVFLAESLASFLENFLGRELYFDASGLDRAALGIGPETRKLAAFLKEKNIIESFGSGTFYPDEPKIFSFAVKTKALSAKSSGNWCGGNSLKNIEEASIKAIAEAIERYSLCGWQDRDLIVDSCANLQK